MREPIRPNRLSGRCFEAAILEAVVIDIISVRVLVIEQDAHKTLRGSFLHMPFDDIKTLDVAFF